MSESDVAKFLYLEARLMDEHRYEEWLSLWADDGVYWVPNRHEDTDPTRQVSIIYDNRTKIGDRVARLLSGTVLPQDPPPRNRRIVSNIEIEQDTGSDVTVASNFLLVQARGSQQFIWCGRTIHKLRREGGALKLAHKKVLLVNSEQEMPVLQFLI
jgi:3-phenylpropionate/cinnamic acid dioxygenase small subunit